MVVPLAMAFGTSDIDVWKEMHFDFVDTIALTVFAAATFDIKTKTAGFVASDFGLGLGGKQLSDSCKYPSVGSWIRTRSANIPDEALMTPEEIRAMLEEANKSAERQIASGEFISLQDVKDGLRQKYGLKL